MTVLRTYLTAFFAAITLYTLIVIFKHGIGLLPIFMGDLVSLGWRGQFNLDFAGYLILSALWVAWRSGFSRGGIVLALIASFAGMIFFAPLLLLMSARAAGDLRKLLLGVHA